MSDIDETKKFFDEGNKYLAEKKYEKAIECFTKVWGGLI